MESVIDDAPNQLRREAAGEFRCEGRSERVEVGALVGAEAARRDNFPEVRVVGFGGKGSAGAEEAREEAAVLVFNRVVQGRVSRTISDVDGSTVSDKVYAEALYKDPSATLDDLREAIATLDVSGRIAKRVFGESHPVTRLIEIELRNARVARWRHGLFSTQAGKK